MLSKFGEVKDVFMKNPDVKSLSNLPETKRNNILAHQFAFVTFKNFESASRAVNEFPYLKINDKKYNDELNKLVEKIRSNNLVEKE
jgi:RNA recognition motif. (a.k.a. RRM, RBD, or RNP domain)